MKLHRIITEELFSTASLISTLSELEVEKEPRDITLEIEFKDAVVETKVRVWGYFDEQKQTHEYPPFSDLIDVGIEIEKVTVSYNANVLEEKVKNIMLH